MVKTRFSAHLNILSPFSADFYSGELIPIGSNVTIRLREIFAWRRQPFWRNCKGADGVLGDWALARCAGGVWRGRVRRSWLEGWIAMGSWGMAAGADVGVFGVGAGKGFGVPGPWSFSFVRAF